MMDHNEAKRMALADLGVLVSDLRTSTYKQTAPITSESLINSLRDEIEALRSENFKLRWNFRMAAVPGEGWDVCRIEKWPWFDGYDCNDIEDSDFDAFQKTLKPSKRAKIPR